MKNLLPLLAFIIIFVFLFFTCGDKENALHQDSEFLKGYIVTKPNDGTRYGVITIPHGQNLRMVFYQAKSSNDLSVGTYVQCQLYKKGNFVEAKNLKKYEFGDKVLNDPKNLPPRSKTNIKSLIRELSINAHYHKGDRYSGSGKHDIWHPKKLSSARARTFDGVLHKGIMIQTNELDTLNIYIKSSTNLNTATGYFIHSSSAVSDDTIMVSLSTEHPPHHLIVE